MPGSIQVTSLCLTATFGVDKIQESDNKISVHTLVLRDALIIKSVVVLLNPFQIQAVESLFINGAPIFAQVCNL